MAYGILKFAHILSVVFMAAPLYNLIVVNERVRIGKEPFVVDRYFENIIRGAAARCYIYQLTALATGVMLISAGGFSAGDIIGNRVLLAKLLLLILLLILLSIVHLRIQPGIERLLSRVEGDAIPLEIAGKLSPLRVRRKRLAALCLFVVITIVLLGIQTRLPLGPAPNAVLLALAAIFSYRAFRTTVRFGWI